MPNRRISLLHFGQSRSDLPEVRPFVSRVTIGSPFDADLSPLRCQKNHVAVDALEPAEHSGFLPEFDRSAV